MGRNLQSIRFFKGTFDRSRAGNSLVELPAAIWFFFMVLLFPLADLATVTLRATTVYVAAKHAARAAGRARTFLVNRDNGELSAVNAAQREVFLVKTKGPSGLEISPTDVVISIIGVPVKKSLPPIKQQEKLESIKNGDYIFQIEVRVTGQVQPLVPLNSSVFGNVPGLTAPVPITASFREFCEHPGGLST